MSASIVDDGNFEVMFRHIEMILHPFLTLWFYIFKNIKFNFVFSTMNKLLTDVILISEFFKPNRSPIKTKIT